jgi:hypothetical protein
MISECFQAATRVSIPFVIARRGNESLTWLWELFAVNYRRSNLPSLINPREFFTSLNKTAFTREQRREIASGMMHRKPS